MQHGGWRQPSAEDMTDTMTLSGSLMGAFYQRTCGKVPGAANHRVDPMVASMILFSFPLISSIILTLAGDLPDSPSQTIPILTSASFKDDKDIVIQKRDFHCFDQNSAGRRNE